jgi:(2Fe-2S) ferredoxin
MSEPSDLAPKSKYRRHFFVCQTQRPPSGKPSCSARGAGEVMMALQEGLAGHPELWEQVTVTSTGCLGPCFDGPNIVVYPEGTWYAGVTEDNVGEIVERHLVAGERVEHLVYHWPT